MVTPSHSHPPVSWLRQEQKGAFLSSVPGRTHCWVSPGTRRRNWAPYDSTSCDGYRRHHQPIASLLFPGWLFSYASNVFLGRTYMMSVIWNADSEREDSAWSLVYPKTTVRILLGPIKTEEVKAVPVGSDVSLKSIDAVLWIRVSTLTTSKHIKNNISMTFLFLSLLSLLLS